jgi:two-component system phosphate regulon response regulator PhoB
MTQHILVVEDEPSIAELIAVNLAHAGYEVERALQSDQALSMIHRKAPSLIVLDWMLPGKPGIQFARELKSNEKTKAIPILMLTAKGEEADKVAGLNAGADDYVTKPFSPNEFIARVKALLRRHTSEPDIDAPLIVGPLRLDQGGHRLIAVWPGFDPKAISLGPTDFKLLQFLMLNPERVHTRNQLLDGVWGNDKYIDERTIDVHIKRLREALQPSGCDRFVETVRGAGYRITKTPKEN